MIAGRTSTPIKNQEHSRNTTQVSTVRSSVAPQRPSQQACGPLRNRNWPVKHASPHMEANF